MEEPAAAREQADKDAEQRRHLATPGFRTKVYDGEKEGWKGSYIVPGNRIEASDRTYDVDSSGSLRRVGGRALGRRAQRKAARRAGKF